jgi:hypothetical protein
VHSDHSAALQTTPQEPPKPVVDQLQATHEKPIVSQLADASEAAPTVTPLVQAAEPVRTAEPAPGHVGSALEARTSTPGPGRTQSKEKPAPTTGPVREATVSIKSGSRPPQAAVGTGTLLVAFEGGWAEVSLGEKRLGTTPGRFVVPAGKQTLSVRPFGTGKPFAKRVELAPDQVLKVFLAAPKP